ncbi:hypothetical protein D3C71_905170 [compost metagenome]
MSWVRIFCSCFGSTTFKLPFLSKTVRSFSPLSLMVPLLGCSKKLIQRSKVLLPEPDEPMILMTSPAFASSDIPFSTS